MADAYEHKPGRGSLFKNEKKEKDTQPDYTGGINVDDGAGERWLSAWADKGDSKRVLSISIGDPKEDQPSSKKGGYGNQRQQSYKKQDDLPF